MRERLVEVLHYRRNLKAYRNRLPDGNSLCYEGEVDGRGQETPLVEGNIPTMFEVFPSPFNAGEIIRRQNDRTHNI